MEMIFTESAANQAKVILASEEDGLQLRCFIQGGGCSGFQYKWDMVDEEKDGIVIEDILVVDKIAEMFVLGCTVDYVREFGGSYLKVVNPNAKASCGCGESFAI